MGMFCYQCEQTAKGTGCTVKGVCGKSPEVSALLDLLLYSLKGISFYANAARELGVKDLGVDKLVIEGLFVTVTNVDFNPADIEKRINESYKVKSKIKTLFENAYNEKNGKAFDGNVPEAALCTGKGSRKDMVLLGEEVGLFGDRGPNQDIRGLRELYMYGLKGMAAYADHALLLGKEDEEVTAYFHKALSELLKEDLSVNDLLGLNLELGQVNLKCMGLLDGAHTERYGHPVPTAVSLGVKKGAAILVSGHDLLDLEELLQQTEGKGVSIYTHGEMLPAHGYPELKKYAHLVGHYGGAWQDQAKEFAEFPGAILMTTNCIQEPKDSYVGRIFTTGLVSWPGVKHVENAKGGKDFSVVINSALQAGGFPEDKSNKTITVGFAHNAVLSVAGTVVEAVKSGAIKHFFLIGGCDGAKSGRNYYTELAQKTPKDTIILTLACGKFRFNKLEFGDIGGIPRLLDVGQCNDAYSAIKIASALADAFGCGVNDLPLSLVLSWYEQKAVCILLTLLSLGIKNIRLGPTLPAFVSPAVLNVLVEKFSIAPVTTPEKDLEAMLTK